MQVSIEPNTTVQETGAVEDRLRKCRPTTSFTPENIQTIRSQSQQNPDRSMRKMAEKLGISKWSV
ncbi:hypothetical protein KIN20_024012 [Parelaphostrongylus tenuis]|uniref:Uncharacterized protein n=1 Tax=Parelaphostrongylus tenuis TaxID=148309 RepID=A0AAD5N7S2_PARTN|nr:hypothetical protein KIN20_024012 [Parelaphostrongylus tenuis]